MFVKFNWFLPCPECTSLDGEREETDQSIDLTLLSAFLIVHKINYLFITSNYLLDRK